MPWQRQAHPLGGGVHSQSQPNHFCPSPIALQPFCNRQYPLLPLLWNFLFMLPPPQAQPGLSPLS